MSDSKSMVSNKKPLNFKNNLESNGSRKLPQTGEKQEINSALLSISMLGIVGIIELSLNKKRYK